MSGKLILTKEINGNETELLFNVPGFAKGIYMIKLTGKNTDLSKKVYLS
jgi:hypothetical protein